jgi:hypothetical protein
MNIKIGDQFFHTRTKKTFSVTGFPFAGARIQFHNEDKIGTLYYLKELIEDEIVIHYRNDKELLQLRLIYG